MIKFFLFIIFTNFIKAQYDDLSIDYERGSDPFSKKEKPINSKYADLLIDYERDPDPISKKEKPKNSKYADDLLIDYERGIEPLLSESNEIFIIKRKLATLTKNINSIIQDKLNDVITERFIEINKTFELLNKDLVKFSNKSENNIEEIRNNMSFLQTFNNEMAPSLNNFKNYNLTCNEIEKKINRRNIQYEDQITELSQQVGTLNDTLAPLVEEVNFNFINNKTFYIIKDKVETIDNLISNNSNEIVNIKTTLNNIISDSLTLFNVSYKINSKYEDLDALIKSINDTIVLHINEINFNLSDVKINLLDKINKNFQDIETKIESKKNAGQFIKFKLIQLNSSYVKDYYDFKNRCLL